MSNSNVRSDSWFHPLISPAPGRLDRRRLLWFAGAGATLAATRPELHLLAQTPEASPAVPTGIEGEPEAVAKLDAAAAAMADLETFAIEIETVQGETTILQGLTVGLIEGAVRRPTDFTATVSVVLPFGSLSVTAVGVDGSAWLQNPLDDGAWISLEDASDVIALVNPDSLILAALGFISDARVDGTDRVGGVEITRITGVIDLSALATETGDGAATSLSSEPLDAMLWIDEENLVQEIEIAGPILTTESADVVRVVRFFDFNEPVEIEEPLV